LEKRFFPVTPFDAALAILVFWVGFGLRHCSDLCVGLSKLTGIVLAIYFFYTLCDALSSPERLGLALGIFILIGLSVAIIGTISRTDGSSIPEIDLSNKLKEVPRMIMRLDRAEKGINPNPLAGTLLLFVPLGITSVNSFVKRAGQKRNVKTALLCLSIAVIVAAEFAAIVFSRSFGALGALGIVFLLIGKMRRLLKIGMGIIVVFLLIILIKTPSISQSEIVADLKTNINKSALDRLPFWRGGMAAANENPILGIGMDNFRLRFPFKYEDAHAHNQYIHTAAEIGIPGLIAYLAILISAAWMTIEVGRSRAPDWMIQSMRGLAWGQAGFAIFGLADAIPLGAKPGVFFWMSLAIMTSIYLWVKRQEEGEKRA